MCIRDRFKSIIPEIAKRNFAGIMLVVANPVDILTQVDMITIAASATSS